MNSPKTSYLYECLETGRENTIDNQSVTFLCIVTGVKKKVTKKDDIMAFCGVEDLFGNMEMIVFPKTFVTYSNLLNVGNIILVEGRISVKDEEIKLLAEKITLAPKTVEELPKDKIQPVKQNLKAESTQQEKKKKSGIFIKLPETDTEKIEKLKNLVSIFEGKIPVYLYYENTKKYDFLGTENLTSINQPMINEINRIFGSDNVVVRE